MLSGWPNRTELQEFLRILQRERNIHNIAWGSMSAANNLRLCHPSTTSSLIHQTKANAKLFVLEIWFLGLNFLLSSIGNWEVGQRDLIFQIKMYYDSVICWWMTFNLSNNKILYFHIYKWSSSVFYDAVNRNFHAVLFPLKISIDNLI